MLFTREQAEALLPQLQEELLSMRERKQQIDEVRLELAETVQTTGGNGHVREEALLGEKRRRAERLVEQLNEILARINERGVEVKDIDQGLVDFPSEREGRTVYLCWRLGEERIEWWHELDTGFAGRQRLE